MIDELIDFLIELAVNPSIQISEEALDRHQITDDDLRSALLRKDKNALARYLDPEHLTLAMHNNGAIFAVRGTIKTVSSDQEADRTVSGGTETEPPDKRTDVTFVLEKENLYDLRLTNTHHRHQKFRARVRSGEFEGQEISPEEGAEASEGETL